MHLGFKTGPNNWEEGQRIVEEEGASLGEIWFQIDKKETYNNMLEWLQKHTVDIGLHHWGLIDGKYKTNIASGQEHIRQATLAQIKETIDVGASVGAVYVNAHCGARGTETISFEPTIQEFLQFDNDPKTTHRLFLESTQELFAYAKEQGVLLTIETLPGIEPRTGRMDGYDVGNVHYSQLLRMGKVDGFIANDITHTASQMIMETQDISEVWKKLFLFTQQAAPFTRLVHLNTVVPPFNGTDSHHGLLEEDFRAGAFPSEEQLLEVLRIFKDRDDVFIIPEPAIQMRENFVALKALAARA